MANNENEKTAKEAAEQQAKFLERMAKIAALEAQQQEEAD